MDSLLMSHLPLVMKSIIDILADFPRPWMILANSPSPVQLSHQKLELPDCIFHVILDSALLLLFIKVFRPCEYEELGILDIGWDHLHYLDLGKIVHSEELVLNIHHLLMLRDLVMSCILLIPIPPSSLG